MRWKFGAVVVSVILALPVAAGIVVNDALAPNVINANKQAFVSEFVTRSEFRAISPRGNWRSRSWPSRRRS